MPLPVLSGGKAHRCWCQLVARCKIAVSWLCRLRTFLFQPVACQQVVGFCLAIWVYAGVIISADFNQGIRTLTSWLAFAHVGCEEEFECALGRLGKTLPPTCRGATRFDSFIFHPSLVEIISDMWVGPEHLFADHSPIYVRPRTKVVPGS